MMGVTRESPGGSFFDVTTGGTVQVQLQQVGAEFQMLRQIGYLDPHHPREPFIFPRDPAKFRTDLASIPWFFGWLIPGLGSHLPAILLHDALVREPGTPPDHVGPPVDREEADRILRDAMAGLGTPVVRRWLIWTGVTLATAVTTLRPRWYWAPVAVGTLVLVTVLGTVATLDLFDVWDVLPWMGTRPWPAELIWGAVFAVLIPAVLSLLWGRLWRAGLIAGVSLALLLHVTAAVIAVYSVYWLIEWVVSAPEGLTANVDANRRRRGYRTPGAS